MNVFGEPTVTLLCGDSRDVLRDMADASIDSIVTDPPYALVSITKRFANSPRSERTENTENPYGRTGRGFMGNRWDTGETAFAKDFWSECLRVLKPGGHVISFGGTRSHHWMWCAIENAGFEIRDSLLYLFDVEPMMQTFFESLDDAQRLTFLYLLDQFGPGGALAWSFGTGFPKSHNQSGEFTGWGTALKPGWEVICLARKPLIGTVAGNLAAHRTGAINIDGCRVGWPDGVAPDIGTPEWGGPNKKSTAVPGQNGRTVERIGPSQFGRWPANVLHDGSDEVISTFPNSAGQQGKVDGQDPVTNVYGDFGPRPVAIPRGDSGSAARFFWSSKANKADRADSKHPTVKPVALMRYLCRLVTPPGGTVLDPFAGSGTTGQAALAEGFDAILIEREVEYQNDIRRRLGLPQPTGNVFE